MARRFNGSSDHITFTVSSAIQSLVAGPLTLVVVAKVADGFDGALIHARTSGGTNSWWMEVSGNVWNFGTGTTPKNVGGQTNGSWAAYVGRKASGGANAPRGRKIIFGGATTDTTAGSGLVDGTAPGSGGVLDVGKWGTAAEYLNADVAAAAVFGSDLSDATTATFTTWAAIVAAGPAWAVHFDQANATDAITDATGGGGNSATITGTTIVANPSGFFASGQTFALPVVTETSTATTLGRQKTRALPAAVETDAGQALGRQKTRALPVAAESDTALAPARSKTRALPPATETDTALPLSGGGRVIALPVAVETDTALTLARRKTRALPPAAETDIARSPGRAKARLLPAAMEADTAVPLVGAPDTDEDVMKVGNIMDELAARVRLAPSLAGRTYAYPIGAVQAPAAIVSYPDSITFDATYGRGMDRADWRIVVLVGGPTDRATRDRMTRYLDGSGPESIKALVDGDAGDYVWCDGVRVASAEIDVFSIGGDDLLAAVFTLDVVGQGA